MGNDVPRRRLGRRRRRRRHRAARAYSKKPPPGRGITTPSPPPPADALIARTQNRQRRDGALGGRPRMTEGNARGAFLINICTGLVSRYLFCFISHASTGTRAYIIVCGGVLIGRTIGAFRPLINATAVCINICIFLNTSNSRDRFTE